MSPKLDILGQKFSAWLVVAPAPLKGRSIRWLCRCDCGTERVLYSQPLREGRTSSCGCLKPGLIGKKVKKHGWTGTSEHAIWSGIKARCRNPNVKAYPVYGGAGIKICDRWLNGESGFSGFECFLADMGPRPYPKAKIDRYPTQSGNYEPSNCRWANRLQQTNNRKNTRRIVYRGTEMPLTEAVRLAGSVIHPQGVWQRITQSGWSVDDAVETPRLHVAHNSAAHARAGKVKKAKAA